jgi:hypothetical protein
LGLDQQSGKEKSQMNDITKKVGVDLAKQVFSICELDGSGRDGGRHGSVFRRASLGALVFVIRVGAKADGCAIRQAIPQGPDEQE